MKPTREPAPKWFVVLAIAIIAGTFLATLGTVIWAVIKIVNHFVGA